MPSAHCIHIYKRYLCIYMISETNTIAALILDPIQFVTNYIKLVKTSWTDSTKNSQIECKIRQQLDIKMIPKYRSKTQNLLKFVSLVTIKTLHKTKVNINHTKSLSICLICLMGCFLPLSLIGGWRGGGETSTLNFLFYKIQPR